MSLIRLQSPFQVNLNLIPGRFVASDLVALATMDDPPVVRTLGNISTLTVDIQQSPGYITMAVTTAPTSHGKLVETDILAENDIVIHIIDAVSPVGDGSGWGGAQRFDL